MIMIQSGPPLANTFPWCFCKHPAYPRGQGFTFEPLYQTSRDLLRRYSLEECRSYQVRIAVANMLSLSNRFDDSVADLGRPPNSGVWRPFGLMLAAGVSNRKM